MLKSYELELDCHSFMLTNITSLPFSAQTNMVVKLFENVLLEDRSNEVGKCNE